MTTQEAINKYLAEGNTITKCPKQKPDAKFIVKSKPAKRKLMR